MRIRDKHPGCVTPAESPPALMRSDANQQHSRIKEKVTTRKKAEIGKRERQEEGKAKEGENCLGGEV
jgi:hypothetical protein